MHYAAFFNYAVGTLLTLDFNDYYTSGNGGMLGYYNGANVAALPLISGLDTRSLNINPSFASEGGTAAANYIPTSDKLEGTTINTVSNDYASVTRAATPTLGVYEVTLNLNLDVYKAGVFQSSYSRLKDAFDKINNGTHTGVLEIRIKANTTEMASAVLYQSGNTTGGGTSNYTSVSIYPTVAGLTVTGNFDNHLIDLNGADNVTIDGRVGATGSTKSLTIDNTYTGNSASTIRFYNSAESNMVKYCNIKGSETNASCGVVYFSTSNTGNGNINNTVDNNNISGNGDVRPSTALYSYGSTGKENSGNIISNNNFNNFLNPNATSNGIFIGGFSNTWTISGNSFYETTTLIPTGAYTFTPVRISANENNLISGNYIGGSAPQCGGAALTVNSSTATYFCSLYVSGATGNPCVVQNNTIQNINYTSTEDNPWDGIFINSGDVTVTGNTIGATTGNGSITVTTPLAVATATMSGGVITAVTLISGGSGYTTPPAISFYPLTYTTPAIATAVISGGVITAINLTNGGSGYPSTPSVVFDGQSNNYSTSHGMINAGVGTVIISNNTIGSVTTIGSTTYSHGFESIYLRGATGTTTLTANLIGSLTTPNSINTSSAATSSLQKQDVYGIYNNSGGSAIITGNTIANITNSYSGTNGASRTRPIATIAGTNTIQNNLVRNITSASGQTGTMSTASVIGIAQTSAIDGTTQIVNGNTIYNLYNSNPSAQTVIYGIYYGGPNSGTNSVSSNLVHSISFASPNTSCDMEGILFNNGLTTCFNNIINLGVGITTGYKINGIWDESSATNNNNIYFNSVYLGGTVASGVTSSTAALWNKNNTSNRNYRNNILMNARTGGTTGKHYAIRLEGMTNVTIDYNDYYSASGSLGRIGTLDKADLAAWKSGTSQDVNSLGNDPAFTLAGGTAALNYYTSAVLPGITGTGITTDYSGITRGSTPKMGALETNNYVWQGNVSNDFATPANWSGAVVPSNGMDIAFASSPANNCVLDQARALGDINNAQATYKLVINGKQLALNKSLNFSNGAQIDATAASSEVVFAGSSVQNIPNGAFLSNTINALTINNTKGLTLNSDITITKTLSLINGQININGKALSITNDAVITLTGGSLSTAPTFPGMVDVVYNQFASLTESGNELPDDASKIRDLTISNNNGVKLLKNITVNRNLVFTTGKIDITGGNLTLADGATITGYDAAKYIIAGGATYVPGAGRLIRSVNSSTPVSNQVFPVGTETSYTPCYISTTNATGTNYKVNLFGTVLSKGTSGDDISKGDNIVRCTWDIVPENTNNAKQTMLKLQWNDADQHNLSDPASVSLYQNHHIAGIDETWTMLSGNYQYSGSGPFTASVDGINTFSNFIIEGKSSPLPISLLSFTVSCNGDNNQLEWVTATETNNDYFTIERSFDVKNWNLVGIVKGAGNSNELKSYSLTDKASDQIIYYRLKQTDFDGKFSYSGTIYSEPCTQNESSIISVYPNPFNVNLSIDMFSKTEQIVTIIISSTEGNMVYTRQFYLSSGDNTEIVDLSDLKGGTYLLYISNAPHKIYKIIKQ